jgi:DNA-binding CsgD family transcriptional regulator
MNTPVSELKTEFQALIDAHTCTITASMLLKRDAQFEIFSKLTRQKANSYTVFDMHEGRYVFHSSAHGRWLDTPCIETDRQENTGRLFELTHPDDRSNVLKNKLKGFSDLMKLPPHERRDFSFRYLNRIIDNKGGYQLYIHCVSVMLCDEQDIPWLILIVTERLPECCCNEKCMADIYNLLPLIGSSKSQHKTDLYLSAHHLRILGMVYDGLNQHQIASNLNISPDTIRGHYTLIRKKLNIKSILMASIYAKIIGLLNVLLICLFLAPS